MLLFAFLGCWTTIVSYRLYQRVDIRLNMVSYGLCFINTRAYKQFCNSTMFYEIIEIQRQL